MTTPTRNIGYRVPAGHGEELFVPPRDELPELLERNLVAPKGRLRGLFDISWAELASQTRSEVLAAALRYTRQYADVATGVPATGPLVLTGHQPELFHPGVWFKNFAAGDLAERVGGVALNLIIDNDLCRSPTIAVPSGGVDNPRVERVPFDQQAAEVPHEERSIVDRSLWDTFGRRVARTLAPLVADPLIGDWWPLAVAAADGQGKLGWTVSQARHQLELAWGNSSLELPQSLVCQTAGFRCFALDLLVRATEFREVYNAALADYRRTHRLRNRAQPVPDLGGDDPWSESPFWVWTVADPRRRALYVRRSGRQLFLSDRKAWEDSLELEDDDPAKAVEILADWQRQGVRLRTRALTTTLFARLLIGDLFIHGIGGAKYDQVTDAICTRFFGVSLPALAVVSGTYRLPLPKPPGRRESSASLHRQLRNLEFHPECYLDRLSETDRQADAVISAATAKQAWLANAKTPDNAAERHRAIVAANTVLRTRLSSYRTQLETMLQGAKQRERSLQILESREYPFCLFPAAELQQYFSSRKKQPRHSGSPV
jgi:hypothetical protein